MVCARGQCRKAMQLEDKALPRTSPKNRLVYQAVVFVVIGSTSKVPLVSLGR